MDNRLLFLGLEMPPNLFGREVIHCPLIRIIPRAPSDVGIETAFRKFPSCTHILFTSKSAVHIFFSFFSYFHIDVKDVQKKQILAVGKRTALCVEQYVDCSPLVARNESAEGVIELLSSLRPNSRETWKDWLLFWPHAAKSRPVLEQWMQENFLAFCAPVVYDTVSIKPDRLPSPHTYDEIVFTSPSVVEAYLEIFGSLPADKVLTSIGPITEQRLQLEITLNKLNK